MCVLKIIPYNVRTINVMLMAHYWKRYALISKDCIPLVIKSITLKLMRVLKHLSKFIFAFTNKRNVFSNFDFIGKRKYWLWTGGKGKRMRLLIAKWFFVRSLEYWSVFVIHTTHMTSFFAHFQSVLETWWKFEKIAFIFKFHKKHNFCKIQKMFSVLFFLLHY